MKNLKILFLNICVIVMFNSCIKEELSLKKEAFYPEQIAIPTELKGKVIDDVSNSPVAGQEIKIIKYWSRGGSSLRSQIATVITDSNGNYSYMFDHKDEQFKKDVYYNIETTAPNKYIWYVDRSERGARPGEVKTLNIKLLKPIFLKLNLQISNNLNGPLRTACFVSDGNNRIELYNSDDIISGQNGNFIVTIPSLANKNIGLYFSYVKPNTFGSFDIYYKYILENTTTADVNQFNYTIDCATFIKRP